MFEYSIFYHVSYYKHKAFLSIQKSHWRERKKTVRARYRVREYFLPVVTPALLWQRWQPHLPVALIMCRLLFRLMLYSKSLVKLQGVVVFNIVLSEKILS